MQTLQGYLTSQYEDDKPPLVCCYCNKEMTTAYIGSVTAGWFHMNCQDKALAEGRLILSHGMTGTTVYSEWGGECRR